MLKLLSFFLTLASVQLAFSQYNNPYGNSGSRNYSINTYHSNERAEPRYVDFTFPATETDSLAQVGIYRTYEDFRARRIESYFAYIKTYHAFGNFKVVFMDMNNKKVKLDVNKNEFWGYEKSPRVIMRIDRSSNPCVIILQGTITFYGNYSTDLLSGSGIMRVNQFKPMISKGPNGKMLPLTKKNMRKLIADARDQQALDQLKHTRRRLQPMIDFMVEYNKKHPYPKAE